MALPSPHRGCKSQSPRVASEVRSPRQQCLPCPSAAEGCRHPGPPLLTHSSQPHAQQAVKAPSSCKFCFQRGSRSPKPPPSCGSHKLRCFVTKMLLHCTGGTTSDTEETMLVPREGRIWVLSPWHQPPAHRNNARGNPAPNPLLLAMDSR